MTQNIFTVEAAAAFADEKRREGKTIVTTNGAFDLLHDGHKFLFAECRKNGDVLIVGVNSDRNVRERKGPDRPHDPEQLRARNVRSLVDAVFIFDDADPCLWLPIIKPDTHVNASTYGEDCVEAPVLKEIGAKLILVPVQKDLGSTTSILKSQHNA